jgi:hypothetical protein
MESGRTYWLEVAAASYPAGSPEMGTIVDPKTKTCRTNNRRGALGDLSLLVFAICRTSILDGGSATDDIDLRAPRQLLLAPVDELSPASRAVVPALR